MPRWTAAGICGVLVLGLATGAAAKGGGHGHSGDKHRGHREEAVSETHDTPPGLRKQGKTPPGLEKQDKTPAGWDKGKKTGWEDKPKKESWFKRMFGRGSKKKPHDQE